MGYKGILAAGKIITLVVGGALCKTWHQGILKGILCSPGDQWLDSEAAGTPGLGAGCLTADTPCADVAIPLGCSALRRVVTS